LSGNGNNGTLINGVGFSADNKGVLTFDGADDYVSETASLSNSFWQGNWTASFWVKFNTISDTNSTADRTLIQHGSAEANKGLHLCQRNNRLYHGLFSNDIEGSAPVNSMQWYYTTFTLNNSTRLKQIYINGVLDTEGVGASSYTGSLSNTRIGGSVLGFGLTFDGDIGNCAFYNRVLTVAEIQHNFNALKGRYGI
jgi:hypothetical protein